MSSAKILLNQLKAMANPEKAVGLARFFKTGNGEYGEGDRFLGIPVPQTRALAKNHLSLAIDDTRELLTSPFHEARMCALILWVEQYRRGDERTQKRIFESYLASRKYINNWDLIDLSAPTIPGGYLLNRPRTILDKLSRSKGLWDRRIAILSSFNFIRNDDFDFTLTLAERYLEDREDLIHKATGWMLREIGKRKLRPLILFLNRHAEKMPRTMLRYAIERLPERQRFHYLS